MGKAFVYTMTEADWRRFVSKVDRDGPIPTEPSRPLTTKCWLWTAGLMPAGYGSFWLSGRSVVAHRVMYERHYGPLPARASLLWLDHVCRVRRCVNPTHLELVTPTENQVRAQRPVCKNGHPMSGANLAPHPTRANVRICRACNREKTARYRARRAT